MKHLAFAFEQFHIEMARNASDDFNLFHDKYKWIEIKQNPFQGPIVLGFQLATLIENQMRLYRESNQENQVIADHNLRFSNYQLTFVNAVHPQAPIDLIIKNTIVNTTSGLSIGNRVSMKSEGKTVLLGFKKETAKPLFLADTVFENLPNLDEVPDRTQIPGTEYFFKRKYMHNGSVKNFLSGSLVEQSDYFDELTHVAHYPEIYPCSLTSGALLEKAQLENHDFRLNPMVYTSHEISLDRELLKQLNNNDKLDILIKQLPESEQNTLNQSNILLRTYHCYGLLKNQQVLFRMVVNLAPLKEILKNID